MNPVIRLAALALVSITLGACQEASTEVGDADQGSGEDNLTKACLDCRLVMHRSICGISRMMTVEEVKEVLGEPKRIGSHPGSLDASTQIPFLDYGDAQFDFFQFEGKKRIGSMRTRNPRTRTTRDVGVGSPEATLREKLPGLECSQFASGRSCVLGQGGDIQPGGAMTIFRMKDGVVEEIELTITHG